MTTHLAKPEHEVTYQEICDLVRRHAAADLTALDVLAVVANMVGKLVAMQDQRTISPAMALEVVSRNIEYGNRQMLDQLSQVGGTRQ